VNNRFESLQPGLAWRRQIYNTLKLFRVL